MSPNCQTIIEWIEAKGRKHRKKAFPLKTAPIPVLNLNNDDDEQDKKLKSVLYQNEYETKPKKKRKHEQRIEEELSAALASISTTSHGKAKKSKHDVDGDILHTVAADSKAIKKKKSKRSRSPVVHKVMEKKSDFLKRLSVEEVEVEFSEKKSSKRRKRKRNDDDNMSLDSYRGRSDMGKSSCSSGEDDVVTKRITKKLRRKLGFVAESNKKVLVGELTEFQKKHFLKSKIPVVEISSVSKAKRLKHMKNANNLATQLEDSMQL